MRVVVLRCGWMLHYAGVRAGDPAPIGGGSYNDQHPGHERFNFKDVGGRLYGYFQSSAKAGGLNLWCIDPNAKVDTLDKVLVIFVAKHPRGGQRVVGWYRDATVYATFQPPLGAARSDCGYQVECSVRDAVLLPEDQRAWTVPTGKGGMLRTHVRYPYDQTGTLNIPTWWSDILDNIKRYDGPNLIVPKTTTDEAKAADLLEEQVGGGGRGGF